ncbi:MAG: hypothetical protein C0504_16170 [Candidatus Solibacter sp.]|nr:hypothetical protein [Candidatus Solibacter sp.]
MAELETVQEALTEFGAGLRLDEDELPSLFDAGLLDTSLLLEEALTREFSAALAQRALALRLATKVLIEDPSPDSMALVLHEFGALLGDVESEMLDRPSAAEWRMAKQYSALTANFASPAPAENQGFSELPKMLGNSAWLTGRFKEMSAAGGLEWGGLPPSKGLSRNVGKRWFRRVAGRASGRLCTRLQRLKNGVENRSRQVWLLRRLGEDEYGPSPIYVFAHVELFPGIHSRVNETSLALECARLRGLATGLQLPDLALCFESADWIAHYALSFLLPPSPGEWPVRGARGLRRLLDGRLSRWYFGAFDHRMEPVEMAAAVLRIGRPLFYERVAAHALLEYSLLQGVAFSRSAAPSWMDIQSGLEREFSTLLDGYLLRVFYYPQLKKPDGWCAYLADLHALHFESGFSDGFLDYRARFLQRRGLASAMEILYRTTESHGLVQ